MDRSGVITLLFAKTILLFSLVLSADLNGQKCGQPEIHQALMQQSDDYRQQRAELEIFTREYIKRQAAKDAGEVYTIPTVFHIIHQNGPENISDAQVTDALHILNDDFRALNLDLGDVRDEFKNLIADAEIEFQLAQLDPRGDPTTGITRHESTATDVISGDFSLYELISWPRHKYLNIWVVRSINGGTLAYALLPGAPPASDGVTIQHSYVGSIGSAEGSGFSKHRTLTHEVGHFLNLLHTWGGNNSCGVDSNCSEDDGVEDTPNCVGGCFFANINSSTCGSLDNIQNYMDYYNEMRMFTQGQKDRMRAALNSPVGSRINLWSESNLVQTGLLQPTFSGDITIIENLAQPNPTSGILRLNQGYSISGNSKIRITDVHGRLLDFVPKRGVIDLSETAPGIYFLTLEKDNQTFLQKIIKH